MGTDWIAELAAPECRYRVTFGTGEQHTLTARTVDAAAAAHFKDAPVPVAFWPYAGDVVLVTNGETGDVIARVTRDCRHA